MDLKEIGWEGVGCIDLPQDREKELATVNAEVTFRVPSNAGNFLTHVVLAFQEGLCSME